MKGASRRPPDRKAERNEAPRTQGASRARIAVGDRLQGWWSHHKLVAADSWRRLLATPAGTLMTWLVIGIALALPGGLFVGLSNVESLSKGWDGAAQISLFLHPSLSDRDGRELAQSIEQRPQVAGVRFISRDEALAEFRELSGYGEVLEQLDNNPLPAVIVVSPHEADINAAATETLFDALKALPQVDQAVLDLQWVQRLYSMMALAQRLTLALGLLLAVGVLLVIGNTIRLAIESRRDEILVVKLVGGTDGFVRRPFLYTGLWYGLGGGVVAWLIIQIGLWWLAAPVAHLADLYQSEFSLAGLGVSRSLLLWLSGALLGWLGAWLAVGRHLGAIEPR